MTKVTQRPRKSVLRWTLALLALSWGLQAVAASPPEASGDDSPKPGNYCPGQDIGLIAAEEISVGLDLATRSRAALLNKDFDAAQRTLFAAGTTLRLASSRGGAGRSMVLIDAVVQAKAGENYAHLLTWFPLLKASLLTLPDDPAVQASRDLIGTAESIIEGDTDGDAFETLGKARHMLSCDGLDIPLQEALKAQAALLKELGPDTKASSYDAFIDAARSALKFALGSGEPQ